MIRIIVSSLVVVLLAACSRSPKPEMLEWEHNDNWINRESSISLSLSLPENYRVNNIQLRYSRVATHQNPRNSVSDIYNNGDPGIQINHRINANNTSRYEVNADLKSREWGLGENAGQLYFKTGDKISFSFLVAYTDADGREQSTYTPPQTYSFSNGDNFFYRHSSGRDGSVGIDGLGNFSANITGIEQNILTTKDSYIRNFNNGDEVLLINMQSPKVRPQNVWLPPETVGQYHLGVVKSLSSELLDNGERKYTMELCELLPTLPFVKVPVGKNLNPIDGLWQCKPLIIDCCNDVNRKPVFTKIQVIKIPHYDEVTLPGMTSLGMRRWQWGEGRGGVLAFRAKTLIIPNRAGLDANGDGFLGAGVSPNALPGAQGEGITGPVNYQLPSNFNNPSLERVPEAAIGLSISSTTGGHGANSPCTIYEECSDDRNIEVPVVGAGGGGASHGSEGDRGLTNQEASGFSGGGNGERYYTADFSKLFLGSGGGGGGGGAAFSPGSTWHETGNRANSGSGGGIILISAGQVTLMGSLQANGLAGDTNADPYDPNTGDCRELISPMGGGSGGGSGGSIWLMTPHLIIGDNTSIQAIGGSNRCAVGGGNGGDGVIRVDYNQIEDAVTGQRYEEGTPTAIEMTRRITNPAPVGVSRIH